MIPFADETPGRRFPWVTVVLIALCIIVFFAVQPTHITTCSSWSTTRRSRARS